MPKGVRIAGVASAFPKHYYSQQVLTEELKKYWGDHLPNPQVLDRLHAHAGVEGRHLALPKEEYRDLTTFGQCNSAWIECAQELGQAAICRALSRSGVEPREVSALFSVSITGVASPSLDVRLANRMGLSPNLKRTPIFGLGCSAGAAGIARAYDYVRAYPDQVACLVSVELCSLTWQRDDLSMANIISSGLFADGAAAVVISGADRGPDGPEILGARAVLYPDTEYVMGWDVSEKGFQIVLSPDVPRMTELHLGGDVDALLDEHGLKRQDIGSWILHPGGPKVLEAAAASLNLPPEAVAVSRDSMRRVGNLSSASVLIVLEEFMERHRPAPGSFSVLGALGPGFCSELVLLRW